MFEGLGYDLVKAENFSAWLFHCEDDCDDGVFDETWFFVVWLFTPPGENDAILECMVEAEQLLGFNFEVHFMWEVLDAAATALYAVATSQTGWTVAVGGAGEIRRSKEFLDDWDLIVPPAAFDLFGVCCAGGAVLVAVGAAGSGCLRSTNGGATWTQVVFANGELHAVSRGYEDDDTVIAVGEDGEIWKSVDGGASWTAETSGTVDPFRGVSACAGAMIAVGINGMIRRSVDVGETWSAVTSGTTENFWSVSGWGLVVVAVGDAGTIRRSVNAGATWSTVTSGTTDDLFAVTASPSGRWTACGAGGRILQSQDDGLTWSSTTADTGDLNGAGYGALLGRAVLVGADIVRE
jgi:photosystem II stability/assembly factor-like uncharacterized protein